MSVETTAPDRPGLGPVLLTVFLDLLGFGLVIPLLSFYAESFGATAIQVTLLMAVYSLAQFLAAPVWGAWSDRVGRRQVLMVTVALSALFLAGFAASTTLWQLFLFRALHGIAAANVGTAQAYVADVTTGADRARGMGLIGAAFGVGFSVGPLLGGVLSQWGLAVPIWVAAGLSTVNLAWVVMRLPESRQRVSTGGRRRTISPAALAAALRHPIVGAMIALVFVSTFSFAMLESTFALVAEHEWDLQAHDVGYLFGVIGLVGIVVQGGLIGRLVARFGESRLVVAGMGLEAVGMAALALVPAGAGVWTACAVLALGTSLANPSMMSLISRGTSEDDQGAVLGSSQSLSALARATAPAMGGWLYVTWMPGGAMLTGAGLMLLAMLFSVGATRAARRDLEARPADASSPG